MIYSENLPVTSGEKYIFKEINTNKNKKKKYWQFVQVEDRK